MANRLVKKFYFNACPHCRGALALDRTYETPLVTPATLTYVCIQCGRRIEIPAALDAA